VLILTRKGIRDYLRTFRKASLDKLAEIANPESSLRHSLYGRNTVSKIGTVGECDPNGAETWSISAYDALLPIYNAVKEHGHKGGLEWLGRVMKFALDIVPWWINAFQIPPGEDARFEPCESRDEMLAQGKKGDTDPRRHFACYGLALLVVKLLHLNLWTKAQAINFLWTLLADQLNSLPRRARFQREYLRYGHTIAGLAGICEAAHELGADGEAIKAAAHHALTNAVAFAYRGEWATRHDRDVMDLRIWTYGGFRFDDYLNRYTPAFPDGHFLYGGQTWYYAICGRALARTWRTAKLIGDKALEGLAITRFFQLTDWMDPLLRTQMPTRPLWNEDATAEGPMFFNSLLMGGTRDGTTRPPYLTVDDARDGKVLSISQWEELAQDQTFVRFAGCEFHEGDEDAYWATTYTDPAGVTHKRGHGNAGRQAPGLPGYDVQNCHAMWGCLIMRALASGNPNLRRLAEIAGVTAVALGNSTDLHQSLSRAMDPEKGMHTGLNAVGQFSRAYCWNWSAMDELALSLQV
jgi:hypothetical protein